MVCGAASIGMARGMGNRWDGERGASVNEMSGCLSAIWKHQIACLARWPLSFRP